MAGLSMIFVMLAAFFWGVSGGIGAILMTEGWDPLVVSFYRGVVGLLFVLVWLALRPRDSGLSSSRLWFWSAIAGLGIAGNFTFYFLSISEGSLAVAATLMYCAPVFVYLVSFLLKLESFSGLKAAAIVVVIFGIMLLTRLYDIEGGSITPVGVITGLLAGVCYALFIFGFKYAAVYGKPQSVLMIAFTTLVTVLIVLGDRGQMVSALSSPDLRLFLLLGLLGGGVSFVIYFVGLKWTAPTIASILAMVEPVTATLFSIVVLHENLVSLQILGMALVLITVTVLSVYSNIHRAHSN